MPLRSLDTWSWRYCGKRRDKQESSMRHSTVTAQFLSAILIYWVFPVSRTFLLVKRCFFLNQTIFWQANSDRSKGCLCSGSCLISTREMEQRNDAEKHLCRGIKALKTKEKDKHTKKLKWDFSINSSHRLLYDKINNTIFTFDVWDRVSLCSPSWPGISM